MHAGHKTLQEEVMGRIGTKLLNLSYWQVSHKMPSPFHTTKKKKHSLRNVLNVCEILQNELRVKGQ